MTMPKTTKYDKSQSICLLYPTFGPMASQAGTKPVGRGLNATSILICWGSHRPRDFLPSLSMKQTRGCWSSTPSLYLQGLCSTPMISTIAALVRFYLCKRCGRSAGHEHTLYPCQGPHLQVCSQVLYMVKYHGWS